MDGILTVDKPAGWTSHDVVNFLRKRFSIKKVGHTGTLDPMATGMLVLLLGNYTKLSAKLTGCLKKYRTILTLGEATDTGDAAGKTVQTAAIPDLKKCDIENILKKFTGEIEQAPPMVSAVKFHGQRLYKLARQGKHIETKPRKVVIEEIKLGSFALPDISMFVVCRKGVYIRTLCEDIAKALGSCGHMSYLRRLGCGEFCVEEALNIERLKTILPEELKNEVKNLTLDSNVS